MSEARTYQNSYNEALKAVGGWQRIEEISQRTLRFGGTKQKVWLVRRFNEKKVTKLNPSGHEKIYLPRYPDIPRAVTDFSRPLA